MINWSLSICRLAAHNVVPAALVVAALNMSVQILFSLIFGADHVPKLRGDRGA